MPKIKVDLEVGPAMDIEFLAIEGTKVTNTIVPTGSKWKISLEFEDISPANQVHVQMVATGIPRNECELMVRVNKKDGKMNQPVKTFNDRGFRFYEEKVTWTA